MIIDGMGINYGRDGKKIEQKIRWNREPEQEYNY